MAKEDNYIVMHPQWHQCSSIGFFRTWKQWRYLLFPYNGWTTALIGRERERRTLHFLLHPSLYPNVNPSTSNYLFTYHFGHPEDHLAGMHQRSVTGHLKSIPLTARDRLLLPQSNRHTVCLACHYTIDRYNFNEPINWYDSLRLPRRAFSVRHPALLIILPLSVRTRGNIIMNIPEPVLYRTMSHDM